MDKDIERKWALIRCWTLPFSLMIALLPLFIGNTDVVAWWISGANLGIFFWNFLEGVPRLLNWI